MGFEQCIEDIVKSHISRLNTAFIGKIEKINKNNTVAIQPVLKRVIDKKVETIKVIDDVPFFRKKSSTGGTDLEFKKGDYVLCIALQRDHSNFFDTLEEDIAPTKRSYSLSDIIALPYFFSTKETIKEEIKGWSIKNKVSIKLILDDDNYIKIDEDKSISIKSTKSINLNLNNKSTIELKNDKLKIDINGVDLLDTLSKAFEALGLSTVTTVAGPQQLSHAKEFLELKTKIDKIKF